MKPFSRSFLALSFAFALIGCALLGQATPVPTAPAAAPSQPVALTSPVALDLCSLVTSDEVASAIGEPVAVQPDLQTGACTFASTGGGSPKSVGVSAAQGEQARRLVQMSTSLALMFGQDPAAQAIAKDLEANASTMALTEVVEKGNQILQTMGYAFQSADAPQGKSFWGWNPLGAGTLQHVKADTYWSVSLTGLDEAVARSAAQQLSPLVESRLPPAFTISLGDSIRIQFTTEPPTAEPEATPTWVPEPPTADPAATPTWVR